jgi:hypothetical protein
VQASLEHLLAHHTVAQYAPFVAENAPLEQVRYQLAQVLKAAIVM